MKGDPVSQGHQILEEAIKVLTVIGIKGHQKCELYHMLMNMHPVALLGPPRK